MKYIDFRGFSGPNGCLAPWKEKKLSPLDEFLNTPMRILFQETSKRTKTNKKNHNRAIPLCNNFYFTQYLKPLIVGIYVACHIQVLNTIVYHLFRPCRVLELKAFVPSNMNLYFHHMYNIFIRYVIAIYWRKGGLGNYRYVLSV